MPFFKPLFKKDTAAHWVHEARVLFSQLPARGLVGSRKANAPFLSGQHPSQLHGEGSEFHQLRPFQQGDPLTAIDWRATARTARHVITKEKKREGQIKTLLVCDASASMTHDTLMAKYERAATLSLTLALAIRKNEQSLIVYRTRQRTQDIMAMARHLWQETRLANPVSLEERLRHHGKGYRLIVMTDGFLPRDEWRTIFQTITGHAMRGALVLIHAREEMAFPFTGRILFSDEHNERLIYSASHQQAHYMKALRLHHDWLYEQAHKSSLRCFTHCIDEDARATLLSVTHHLTDLT